MPRILLDEDVPAGLRHLVPGHDVRTVPDMGWAGMANGQLLAAAEADGFDIFITGDRNIAHQQAIVGRRLAIIVLSEIHWPTIRQHPDPICQAVERAREGAYIEVVLPRPPQRRRPAPNCGGNQPD